MEKFQDMEIILDMEIFWMCKLNIIHYIKQTSVKNFICPFINKINRWVYNDYFIKNQLLAYFPYTDMN